MKQSGFSIIEIMVALALSVVLAVGAITIVSNTSSGFKHTDARSRVQENARFALEMLTHDLRQVGYFGCAMGTPLDEEMIEATDGDGDTSDAITVRFSDSSGAMFDVPTPPSAGDTEIDLFYPGTLDEVPVEDLFQEDQRITVADCGNVEWAVISGLDGNTITLADPLETAFNPVTQIRLLGSYAYRVDVRDEDSVPVLLRSVNGGDEEEMVEGVEHLRFLYGIDQDSDRVPDEFRSDVTLAAGESVVSIKIGLILRSISNESTLEDNGGQLGVTETSGSIELLDQTVELPAVRASRQTFTTALMVRN